MTCYFGFDLANRVMQEDIADMLDSAMDEIKETLTHIKSLFLDGKYGDVSDQERKKFWSATYAMMIDNLEYIINDVDKAE